MKIDINELQVGDIVWEPYGGYRLVHEIKSQFDIRLIGLHWGIPGSFDPSEVQYAHIDMNLLQSLGFDTFNLTGQKPYAIINIERNIYLRAFSMTSQTLPLVDLKENDTILMLPEINYMHQIQRLYTDLTKRKLTIIKKDENS